MGWEREPPMLAVPSLIVAHHLPLRWDRLALWTTPLCGRFILTAAPGVIVR